MTNKFEIIFKCAPHGIAIITSDNKIDEVNISLCKLVGYSKEELISMSITDIIHKDDINSDYLLLERLSKDEINNYTIDKRFTRKDGRIIWLKISVTKIPEIGPPEYYILQVVDITPLKAYESKLLQMENKYNTLLGPATLDIKDTIKNATKEIEKYVRKSKYK